MVISTLLYIDPGTGSMLFTILIGIFSALVYALRLSFVKLKFFFTKGKKNEQQEEKKDFVFFSDNKRYWNVFAPICEEMDKRGKDVTYLTFSEDDPVFNCGFSHIHPEYIGNSSKGFFYLNSLNATIVLSSTPSLDVYQWKRSKSVNYYIHIMHNFGEILVYKSFGIDYYDSILISGENEYEAVRALEKLRALPQKELPMVGIPYMDEMVKRYQKDIASHDKNRSMEFSQKNILLAPSWGESSILTRYGSHFIDKLLETGYHIIIRPHPQSFSSEKELIDDLLRKYPDSDQLEWNRDVDNYSVLLKSDILISDFSGVIFEFALIFNKPVIYADTSFDSAPYDLWWLNRECWTLSVLPLLGEQLSPEKVDIIKDVIDSCIDNEKYVYGRQRIIDEAWECFGKGTEKVCDYLINKFNEITEKNSEREV